MLVCEVQGGRCIVVGKMAAVSSHSTLPAYPILSHVAHVSPEIIFASHVPWRSTPEPFHPYFLSSWAVAIFNCILLPHCLISNH